jgi:hypothetical protein
MLLLWFVREINFIIYIIIYVIIYDFFMLLIMIFYAINPLTMTSTNNMIHVTNN